MIKNYNIKRRKIGLSVLILFLTIFAIFVFSLNINKVSADPITRGQVVFGTKSGVSTTVSASWASATTAGNLLVAIVSFDDGTDITITPPAGGWTLAKRQNNTTRIGSAIYYIANAASQSGSKTWGISPSARSAVVMMEYSGIATVSPLDKTASTLGASNTVSSGTTTATAQNNEVAIAALVTRESNDVLSNAPTNGFVQLGEYDGGDNRVTMGIYEKTLTTIGTYGTQDGVNDNEEWVGIIVTFKAPAYTISGTTNLANGSTVAIALNGVLQTGLTGTVSSGSWSISGVPLAANDIVTVWNDGATEANESTAVTKQAGADGNITGMVLNRHVLSLGSSTDQSLTLANLGLYDNDNDEDIMHSANASVINVDAGNSYSDEKIDILSGDTLTIGGTETLTTLDLTINGTLTSGGNSAYNVGGNWTKNGTFTPSTSTTVFNGTSAQTISGSASTTFNNLTVGNTTTGVGASIDSTVNGVLSLSANPSATVGSLNTGANTLTMGASATTVGAGDVVGIVKRTTLIADTTYTFGNQYTTIRFENVGTLPTDVSVKITIGSAPAWKTDAIRRTYDLIQTGGSGSYVTINLHYLDAELNGNTENTLVTWDEDPPGPEEEHGRSNYDLTNNWVGISGLPVSYLGTSFGINAWTLGDTLLSSSTWNGSLDTNWQIAGNWTPNGVPSDLADVVIPDASTTPNDPILSPGQILVVGRLTLESGAILNSSSSYTATISGASGAWSNNGGIFNAGTGTVIFTNSNATMSGETDFYNVTIDAGAKLKLGSNTVMRIAGTMTNNGIWDVEGGHEVHNTVEYNGGAQTILNPNGTKPRLP
ncbi:MAG: hypothetical protein Q8O95_01505 [bacterium]|nr:hypothetical protein [bacterium]